MEFLLNLVPQPHLVLPLADQGRSLQAQLQLGLHAVTTQSHPQHSVVLTYSWQLIMLQLPRGTGALGLWTCSHAQCLEPVWLLLGGSELSFVPALQV